MDPAILVLDEPTTGQDADGVARVGAVVEAMRAAGRTVVAITHDMEFAATRFGRVVIMRDGVVVADGPPERVFAPAGLDLLASTGLTPPPAARVAARMGLDVVPLDAAGLSTGSRRPRLSAGDVQTPAAERRGRYAREDQPAPSRRTCRGRVAWPFELSTVSTTRSGASVDVGPVDLAMRGHDDDHVRPAEQLVERRAGPDLRRRRRGRCRRAGRGT